MKYLRKEPFTVPALSAKDWERIFGKGQNEVGGQNHNATFNRVLRQKNQRTQGE